MRVCTLCNGLYQMDKNCPACGRPLTDGGPIEDYYGPYSPYMDKKDFKAVNQGCVHLLYCSQCGFDTRECAPEAEV